MWIMIFWVSLLGYPFRDSTSLGFLKLAASGRRDGDCFQPAADPTALLVSVLISTTSHISSRMTPLVPINILLTLAP